MTCGGAEALLQQALELAPDYVAGVDSAGLCVYAPRHIW